MNNSHWQNHKTIQFIQAKSFNAVFIRSKGACACYVTLNKLKNSWKYRTTVLRIDWFLEHSYSIIHQNIFCYIIYEPSLNFSAPEDFKSLLQVRRPNFSPSIRCIYVSFYALVVAINSSVNLRLMVNSFPFPAAVKSLQERLKSEKEKVSKYSLSRWKSESQKIIC